MQPFLVHRKSRSKRCGIRVVWQCLRWSRMNNSIQTHGWMYRAECVCHRRRPPDRYATSNTHSKWTKIRTAYRLWATSLDNRGRWPAPRVVVQVSRRATRRLFGKTRTPALSDLLLHLPLAYHNLPLLSTDR